MKLSKDEALALAAVLAFMRPDWQKVDVVNLIGEHREQEGYPAFVEQAVAHAAAGHPLIAIVHPFERPAPAPVIPITVNEDDPSKSRLLRKTDSSDSRGAAVREPNPDPKHWRNRFAAEIEKGRREHEELMRKMRHAPYELNDADRVTISRALDQHARNVEAGIAPTEPLSDSTRELMNTTLDEYADEMLTRYSTPHALAPDDEFSAEAIAARAAEGDHYSHE